jgi:hypothetical protein
MDTSSFDRRLVSNESRPTLESSPPPTDLINGIDDIG